MACGYKATLSNMKKHVQRKHMDHVKFPCTLCDREMKSDVDRKAHYAKAHGLNLSVAEIADLKSFKKEKQ